MSGHARTPKLRSLATVRGLVVPTCRYNIPNQYILRLCLLLIFQRASFSLSASLYSDYTSTRMFSAHTSLFGQMPASHDRTSLDLGSVLEAQSPLLDLIRASVNGARVNVDYGAVPLAPPPPSGVVGAAVDGARLGRRPVPRAQASLSGSVGAMVVRALFSLFSVRLAQAPLLGSLGASFAGALLSWFLRFGSCGLFLG